MQNIAIAGKNIWFLFGDKNSEDSTPLLKTLATEAFSLDVNIEKKNHRSYITSHSGYFCSASDSQNLRCVAISNETKVGVDVEFLKPRKSELLSYCASVDENVLMRKHFPTLEYLETIIWSLKESVQKSDDEIFPPNDYHITSIEGLEIILIRGERRWNCIFYIQDGYVVSVSSRLI